MLTTPTAKAVGFPVPIVNGNIIIIQKIIIM